MGQELSNADHLRLTSGSPVELDDDLRAHIDAFNFSIFSAVPPLRLIDEHALTRWHVARFGSGLPARPAVPSPPPLPATEEVTYVGELLGAYAEHLATKTAQTLALTAHALANATTVPDRHGICHQLANDGYAFRGSGRGAGISGSGA